VLISSNLILINNVLTLINNKLILFNLNLKLNNNDLITFNLNLFTLNENLTSLSSLKLNYINKALKEKIVITNKNAS